jgi:hypothetical protein
VHHVSFTILIVNHGLVGCALQKKRYYHTQHHMYCSVISNILDSTNKSLLIYNIWNWGGGGVLIYWGHWRICTGRLWKRASFSIEAPSGLREDRKVRFCFIMRPCLLENPRDTFTGDFERQKYLGSFFLGPRGFQQSKSGGNLEIQ